MMNIMNEVTGDALEAMQDAWESRETFARLELGGVPEWADYVDFGGQFWSDAEARDECEAELTDLYGTVAVCGFDYDAGAALRQLDPVAFRSAFVDWESERVASGAWRRIEG